MQEHINETQLLSIKRYNGYYLTKELWIKYKLKSTQKPDIENEIKIVIGYHSW